MNNSAFPIIRTISDLLPHIADKPEILVRPGPFGSKVVCYQFQDNKTFDNAFAAECRGLVFDRNDQLVARPLHKFFNIGERPGTEPDLESAVRVMDKRDGSMIHTVWLDGQLLLKSKKAFKNSQVNMARECMTADLLYMCTGLASAGMTAIFELTAPSNRIVVAYDKPELRLLHIRRNECGSYLPAKVLEGIAHHAGVKLVDEGMSVAAALESLPGLTDAEGYVLQFENGDMVKAKCPWYLNLHRTLSFTRERDIAEAALEERLDDIKSALTTTGASLEAVNAIESKVKQHLVEAQRLVDATMAAAQGMDRKTFALEYKAHPHFGMLMAAFVGKEPDFKDWFRKHILKQQFSLEPVAGAVAED